MCAASSTCHQLRPGYRPSVGRDQWRRLFKADLDALPSQAPEWVDALCVQRGYRDASRLYEMSDGRCAVLPLVRRTGLSGWLGTAESMPSSWGFGGPIAPDGVTTDLVGAVLDDLCRALTCRAHLRPNPLHASAWASAAAGRRSVHPLPRRAHVLDLAGGFDVVWNERFKPATRTKVRRAERLGVVVRTDTSGELVGMFHELLRRAFDRWADQQHEPHWMAQYRGRYRDPLDKFQVFAERLGDGCRISVAWYDGRPAAAVLVLQSANVAHYTRGAMDKPLAASSFANYLLHARAIQAACEQGCRSYHMGESGSSAGLSRFKENFGARAYSYAEYRIERIPVSRFEAMAKAVVKKAIGFRDV